MAITKLQSNRLHRLYNTTQPALEDLFRAALESTLWGVRGDSGIMLFDLEPIGPSGSKRAQVIREAVLGQLIREWEEMRAEMIQLGGEAPEPAATLFKTDDALKLQGRQ